MLDVFITVDVEIWCDGWHDLDARFSGAFERYVHGPTASGPYGLPHLLTVLGDHGLAGNFFVEPLFSARFGAQPLAEIVGLIQQEAAGMVAAQLLGSTEELGADRIDIAVALLRMAPEQPAPFHVMPGFDPLRAIELSQLPGGAEELA